MIGIVTFLVLLVGGIVLYKTYAFYEEKKEYNVLKGIVPEFNTEFRKLVTIINSSASNMDELLENSSDVTNLVASEEAMNLLISNETLLQNLKESEQYTEDVKQKILDSTVIREDEKYNVGLPCYLFSNEAPSNTLGGFTITNYTHNISSTYYPDFYAGTFAVPDKSNHSVLIGNNKINLQSYTTLKIDLSTYTNNASLSGIGNCGISDEANSYDYVKSNGNFTFTSNYVNKIITIDIHDYYESYYLKFTLQHGGEINYYSAFMQINSIVLY